MRDAAAQLLGTHDFTTFRSVRGQANSPMRTLDRLDVRRQGELIEIRATAQSFLHNQIRSFAGTLKLAGEGKMTPDDVQAVLPQTIAHRLVPVGDAGRGAVEQVRAMVDALPLP